jgi:hypothetical protein
LRDDDNDYDDENTLTAKTAMKKPTRSQRPAVTQPIADRDIEMNEDLDDSYINSSRTAREKKIRFAPVDFEIDKGRSSRLGTKASSRCLIVSI